jgi:chemotaxis protein MotB
MADDKDQPIIIKKKKGGHGGPHGGAWKLAYADLVTAMMAFFLVMWIVGLDVKTRNGLAEYFSNPGAFTIDYRSSPYIMKTDGRASITNDQVEQSSRHEVNIDIDDAEALAARIRNASAADAALRQVRDHLDVQVTEDGVAVAFSESRGGTLFVPGTAELRPPGRQLLQAISPILIAARRGVALRSHAAKRQTGDRYGAWDVSADRGTTVRKALIEAGLPTDRWVRSESVADRIPKNAQDPTDPANDRIVLLIPFEKE